MLHDIVYFLFVFYYIIYLVNCSRTTSSIYYVFFILDYWNLLPSKEQKHTSSVQECLYRLCIMHLLVIVIFNEKINIKFTKLLFLRFFATIMILKSLKLGTPRSCCTHLLHTSEEILECFSAHGTPVPLLSIYLFLSFFLSCLPLSIGLVRKLFDDYRKKKDVWCLLFFQ